MPTHVYMCMLLKDLSKDGLHSPELAPEDEPKVSNLMVLFTFCHRFLHVANIYFKFLFNNASFFLE